MRFFLSVFSLMCVLGVVSVNPAFAAHARVCQLETTRSIKLRVKSFKLEAKSKNTKIENSRIEKKCPVIRASAVLPTVASIDAWDAKTDKSFASIPVTKTDLKLKVPSNVLSGINFSINLRGSTVAGLYIVFGKSNIRQLGLPYTVFGDQDANIFPRAVKAGMYPLEIRVCKSVSDKICLNKIFSGTITLTAESPSTPTPPAPQATAARTPIPTPTATPAAAAPKPRIDTLNTVVDGVITGEAPLSVFVKGITSFSDIPLYQRCRAIEIPKSAIGGNNYVPLSDANRAEYEAKGDERTACLDQVDNELYRLNGQVLSYKGTFMTASYNWNFGDGSTTSIYNQIDGWNAAHTYEKAGDYTLQLEVIDSEGNKGYKVMPIRVLPSSRRPIYVSQFGFADGDGSSETRPIKSMAQISKLTLNKGDFDLLFKRGETFAFTSADPALTFSKSNIHVGAYGIGEPPLMVWKGGPAPSGRNMFAFNHLGVDGVIENLRFDTDIEGIFGDASYHEQSGMPIAIRNSGTRILIRNNDVRRVGYFIQQMSVPACENKVCVTARPSGLLAVKNVDAMTDGVRGYFIWNGEGYQVNAFGNTVENSLREHIFRSASYYELINAQDNSFRNTQVADGVDFRKSAFNCQQGGLAYIARNTIHEANSIFAPLGAAVGIRGERMRFGKYIGNRIDSRATNVLRSGSADAVALTIGTGALHLTVANNMFEMGNGVAVTALDTSINIEARSDDYDRNASDIIIAHNTMSTPANAVNRRFLNVSGYADGLKIVNNLVAHPNFNSGDYKDPPLSFTTSSDALTGKVDGLAQMSCNVLPVPSTYRNKPFDIAIHGINVINSVWLSVSQWQAKFSSYRLSGKVDIYQNVEIDRDNSTAIPRESAKGIIECPKVEGIQTDFFGNARSGATATAGAYELSE